MASPRADTYTAASGAAVRGGLGGPRANTLVGIWGQSNAIGTAPRGDIALAPLSADAGLATYNAGTFDRVWIWTGSQFDRLQPSLSNNQAQGSSFGVEFGLAVRWMRETSSGDLYLVKHGRGSTGIGAFLPVAADLYPTGAAKHSAAASWLGSNSVTLGQRAMIWIQGEADLGMASSTYQANLDTLTGAWTTDGIRGASDHVMLWQMDPRSASYTSGVYAAKAAFVAANSYASAPVLPYYMQGDNLHLSGRGMVQAGYDCASQICGFPRPLV